MDSLIGEARCHDLGECRLVALGAKPCGGPRQYVAYSAAATDSVTLAGLVATFNRIDGERNRETNTISDCRLVTRPRLVVRDGRCAVEP